MTELLEMLDDTTTDIQCCDDSGDDEPMISPGSRNLLWEGGFTRGVAMYAKLFERGGGVGGGWGGGGAVRLRLFCIPKTGGGGGGRQVK